MKDEITIINFKDRESVKQALRRAAANTGHNNVSEFLQKLVRGNKYVKHELDLMTKEKSLKKVPA